MPFSDNLFPDDFNFPVPSFNQAVTPPDVDPDEGTTILVAYNPDWSPVLAAAVNHLLQYSTWIGNHDELVQAVERAANLKIQLMNPVYVPERDYPAPYWDDEVTVEDEQPAEDQEWYGKVLDENAPADEMTFQQDAVIWLLSGFVAIASALSGPGAIAAALTFRTIAKKFVLAFNRGDVGEQFRIIIDASDYDEVDTEDLPEGEVLELVVDDLPDAEEHQILIVKRNPS
jgi:hypothetical protein